MLVLQTQEQTRLVADIKTAGRTFGGGTDWAVTHGLDIITVIFSALGQYRLPVLKSVQRLYSLAPPAVFGFFTLSIGILKISCFYEESQGIPFTKLVLLHCSQSRIRGSMYTSSLSRITKTIFFLMFEVMLLFHITSLKKLNRWMNTWLNEHLADCMMQVLIFWSCNSRSCGSGDYSIFHLLIPSPKLSELTLPP